MGGVRCQCVFDFTFQLFVARVSESRCLCYVCSLALVACEFQSGLSIIWDQQFPEGRVGCRGTDEQGIFRALLLYLGTVIMDPFTIYLSKPIEHNNTE